jgi:hypothetical protein
LLAALDAGVGDAMLPLRRDAELIGSSGTWQGYGAVLVLRLDDEDERVVQYDSYVVERDAHGCWVRPGSSSGSAIPIAMLERATHGLPDWQGTETLFVGSAFRVVREQLVAGISLMFSRAVAAAEIHHGGDSMILKVPDPGFVTFPVRVLSREDSFRVEAADARGVVIEEICFHYVPDGLML